MRHQCHRCLLHSFHSAGKFPDVAGSFRSRLAVFPNPWLFPIRLRTQSCLNGRLQLSFAPIQKCVWTISFQPVYDLMDRKPPERAVKASLTNPRHFDWDGAEFESEATVCVGIDSPA